MSKKENELSLSQQAECLRTVRVCALIASCGRKLSLVEDRDGRVFALCPTHGELNMSDTRGSR